MKTKKIIVTSCDDCHKLAIKWNEKRQGYTDFCCRLMIKGGKDIIIQNIHIIPEWCPLPDNIGGI